MDVELTAEVRTRTGKGGSRGVRRDDMVPAVVYGPRTSPVSISVSAKRLEKVLQDMGEESKLLQLLIDGEAQSSPRHVLIREIQKHPVRKRFLHVDFYEVPMDQAIVMEVPVELLGEPEGIRLGATLNQIRRTLSVKCMPSDIPERVPVDVSAMKAGDTLHVSDIVGKVPFELADDGRLAIVSLAGPEGGDKEAGEGEASSE